MLLSVAEANPKHIKSARVCEELNVEFRDSTQLVQELEEGKYKQKKLKQKLWDDFKRVCMVKSAIDENCIETY